MQQQTQKKAWVTPELIVLVRNKPEEAVLISCKGNMLVAPDNDNVFCTTKTMCTNCFAVTGS